MEQYQKSFLYALKTDNKRQLELNKRCLELADKAYTEAKKVDEDNDKLLGQIDLNLPCNGAVGRTAAFNAFTQLRNEAKDQLQKLTDKIIEGPQATKPNVDEIEMMRPAHLSGGSSSSSVKEVRDQLECETFRAEKEVLFAENKLLKIMFEDCKKLFKQAYEVLFNLTKEKESMEFERLEMLNLAIYDAEKEPQVDLVTKYKRKTVLCNNWKGNWNGWCPNMVEGDCNFAHGPFELRIKACDYFLQWGYCTKKESCRFAHAPARSCED